MSAQHSAALSRVIVTILGLLGGASSSAGDEESWKPLMQRLPAQANVLVMVHTDKVRSSGFAKQARWDVRDNVNEAMPSILPRRDIRRCVFAARLNLRNQEPRWETAVLETSVPESFAAFAATVEGRRLPIGTAPGLARVLSLVQPAGCGGADRTGRDECAKAGPLPAAGRIR